MDPLVMASIAGGTIGGLGSMVGAKYQADFAREQAEKAWDRESSFAREMSNTAHQREVADLKAAGLNPILSAMGGGGASSPSMNAPMAQAPDFAAAGGGLGNNVQNVLSTINQLRSTDAQIRQIDAGVVNQNKVSDSTALKNRADAAATMSGVDEIPSRIKRNIAEALAAESAAEVHRVSAKRSRAALPGEVLEGKMAGSPAWRAWEELKGGLKGLAHALTFGAAFKGAFSGGKAGKPEPSTLQNYGR